jgi:hypothetical protein
MLPNPYAPPQTSPGDLQSGLRDVDPRLKSSLSNTAIAGMFTIGAIALKVALVWIMCAIDFASLDDIRARRVQPWVGTAERALGSGANVIGLVSVVVFLVWLYHAARNVKRLGRPGLTMSPGMCVGCFFIPFANVFLPYRAVSQIAAASEADGKGRAASVVLAWWLLYLGSSFSTTALRLVRKTLDVGARIGLNAVNDLLATATLMCLVLLVRLITRGQNHWSRQPFD